MYRYLRELIPYNTTTEPTGFKEISRCLVRKDHMCGKFLGASKSCFIACPSTEEVETILALITEKLTKIGIEPVIAIKERAYGQDIFCTKICGKIIESQFCLVILDDTITSIKGNEINIPNPNVYYEYGLMTALSKYVIPIQKEAQKLAFNIQTHDTIKYTPRNLSSELDRALRDAAKITKEEREKPIDASQHSKHLFIRSFEIMGYKTKGSNWFLSDDFDDISLTPFGNPTGDEYLFLGIENNRDSLTNTLTDMQVVIKRLETKHDEFLKDRNFKIEKMKQLKKELNEGDNEQSTRKAGPYSIVSRTNRLQSMIDEQNREIEDISSKLHLIENSKFAIVLLPEVAELKDKLLAQYNSLDKGKINFPLYVGNVSEIRIKDMVVLFKPVTL